MEDERGSYYLARPGDSDARVYVRRGPGGEIEFRLWNRMRPEVWETHEWLPMSVIREAEAMYRRERNPDAKPGSLYDESIARSILREKK